MDGCVAILDAGAQYCKVCLIFRNLSFCKVIDRRIRELNVRSDILPLNTSLDSLLQKGYKYVLDKLFIFVEL